MWAPRTSHPQRGLRTFAGYFRSPLEIAILNDLSVFDRLGLRLRGRLRGSRERHGGLLRGQRRLPGGARGIGVPHGLGQRRRAGQLDDEVSLPISLRVWF
jgi:hypothetical protein